MFDTVEALLTIQITKEAGAIHRLRTYYRKSLIIIIYYIMFKKKKLLLNISTKDVWFYTENIAKTITSIVSKYLVLFLFVYMFFNSIHICIVYDVIFRI